MKIFDNITDIVRDDLKETIQRGSKVSIAAACFDENIPGTVIKEIARRQPLRAVFRDSSFAGSPAKLSAGEIFNMLAPGTGVKVL